MLCKIEKQAKESFVPLCIRVMCGVLLRLHTSLQFSFAVDTNIQLNSKNYALTVSTHITIQFSIDCGSKPWKIPAM